MVSFRLLRWELSFSKSHLESTRALDIGLVVWPDQSGCTDHVIAGVRSDQSATDRGRIPWFFTGDYHLGAVAYNFGLPIVISDVAVVSAVVVALVLVVGDIGVGIRR